MTAAARSQPAGLTVNLAGVPRQKADQVAQCRTAAVSPDVVAAFHTTATSAARTVSTKAVWNEQQQEHAVEVLAALNPRKETVKASRGSYLLLLVSSPWGTK